MKRARATEKLAAKPRPSPLRIWRVFEYRRPLPVRRPRFTT